MHPHKSLLNRAPSPEELRIVARTTILALALASAGAFLWDSGNSQTIIERDSAALLPSRKKMALSTHQ